MKTLKISSLWVFDFQDTVLFHLIKILSRSKIEIVSPHKADILVIGPYDITTIKRRFLNYFLRKGLFFNFSKLFPNIDIYSLRQNNPIRIFLSAENIRHTQFKSDFFITPDLGVFDDNHLRFPSWKDFVDWSSEGIFRNNNHSHPYRFGSHYNIDDLLKPLGSNFLKKKNFCMITSHLGEPRKSMYLAIQKHFKIDGYGPYFDKTIKDHSNSNFKKIDIMTKYAFNLCPENSLYPGFYTEKIPDSFLGKCLPVTWADKYIDVDFNKNSFVNLMDYMQNNYSDICDLLKQESYLKKFIDQPLLLKKPNLDLEKIFVKKIISLI